MRRPALLGKTGSGTFAIPLGMAIYLANIIKHFCDLVPEMEHWLLGLSGQELEIPTQK